MAGFFDTSGLDATSDFGSTNNAAKDFARSGAPSSGIFDKLFGKKGKSSKITSEPLPDITPAAPPAITSAPALVQRVVQASRPPPPPQATPLGPGVAPPQPGMPPPGQGLAPGFPFSPQQLASPAGPFGVMGSTGVPQTPPNVPGLAPGFPFTPQDLAGPNGPFAINAQTLPPYGGRDVLGDRVSQVGSIPRFQGPEPPRRAAPGLAERGAGIFSSDPNSTVKSRFQDAMATPSIWQMLAARLGSAAGDTRPMPPSRESMQSPPYVGPHTPMARETPSQMLRSLGRPQMTPMPESIYGAMPGFFEGGEVQAFARGGYPQLQMGMPQRRPFATGGGQRYVEPDGQGDGRSDHVPAVLSPGEFVQDAETVSLLGNGDNSAGARGMEAIRKEIRKHKGKSLAKGKFSPDAKSPAHYAKVGMKAASKKKGKA